ncbi:unnamed protein product [Lactuca saligna]|uniref:Uncharacterized protein n=1 Tax=Lactuca saligna TaxID=75948 RepID=A0AA35Z8C9_LACSI|nr:unnamed protein product [Lactuca saligna]
MSGKPPPLEQTKPRSHPWLQRSTVFHQILLDKDGAYRGEVFQRFVVYWMVEKMVEKGVIVSSGIGYTEQQKSEYLEMRRLAKCSRDFGTRKIKRGKGKKVDGGCVKSTVAGDDVISDMNRARKVRWWSVAAIKWVSDGPCISGGRILISKGGEGR